MGQCADGENRASRHYLAAIAAHRKPALTDLLHALKPVLLVLMLPPTPLIGLAAVAALLMRRYRRAGSALLAVSLLGLWLACTAGAAQWLALHVIKTPAALSRTTIDGLRAQQSQRHDVAVLVLGGGVKSFSPEYDGPSLKAVTAERFTYGVWLARQLNAPLGFSGGIGWSARHLNVSEASVVERAARDDFKLPLRWSEGRSRDTRENATLSLAMLKADGIKSLVLVTHDLHMPRAERAFVSAAAGQMTIVVAPVGLQRDAMSELGDWMPSGEGLSRVRYAVYEWLALLADH